MITDVGRSIAGSLQSLFTSPVTDSNVEKVMDEICTHLLSCNVPSVLTFNLRSRAMKRIRELPEAVDKARMINSIVFDELVSLLNPGVKASPPDKNKTNIVVFVGLQGSGKTTSVCKYANHYKRKGFRVGIVCADTFRAGAFDQIKQNALKIKVPYFGSSCKDPVEVARLGVERFRLAKHNLILVDTSGRHSQESELFTEMKNLVAAVSPTSVIFVVDASIGSSAEEQARSFKAEVKLGSIILTKMDGAKKFGGALSSVASTGCPVVFVGSGEGMSDFDPFDPKGFVNRLLGRGDFAGLAEKLSDVKMDDAEMIDRLKKGTYTLGDFYNNFQQILSLGSISKIFEMLPSNWMGGLEIPDDKQFKDLVFIFDSFSDKELTSDGSIFLKEPRRLKRVAMGCGCPVERVATLLRQFKKVSQFMKRIGSIPGMSAMLANPRSMKPTQKAQLMRQVRNVIPTDLLDSLSEYMK